MIRQGQAIHPGLAAAFCGALLAIPGAVAAETRPPPPVFKIYFEHPGIYRVAFEDLAGAGLDAGGVASAGLGLTGGGEAVPVWLEDGGDGVFGPGDWIEFRGERLRGEASWASEHSRYNVYFLRFDHREPVRMRPHRSPAATAPSGDGHAYRREQHLESDLVRLRLKARPGGPEEVWYWAKLAHNQRQPFAATLDLGDLEPGAGEAVLRLELRGWSEPRKKAAPEVADHRVEASLGGAGVGVSEWNGTSPHRFEIPLDATGLAAGDHLLELTIPARKGGENGATLIDVVMLNWIEIAYPRGRRIGNAQARFTLADPARRLPVRLVSEPGRELVVYGDGGTRTAAAEMSAALGPEGQVSTFFPHPGDAAFVAAFPEHLYSPAAIVRDRPSRLAEAQNRADYLMISHPRLKAAIEPLARFHRERGLTVQVVDVEDVYDEFSHGVVDPRALRAFLDHAYHRWQRPAPRFVLLVGDASWDGRNALAVDANYADWTYRPRESLHFAKNTSTPYPEGAERNHRGLVPTWNEPTHQGYSANDNYFVAVDGDDDLPDMAIGRFPVVEAEEVAGIVAKTVRYASSPEVGPWRRNVLFITNEDRGLQRVGDLLAGSLAAQGFASHKVYPASSEVSNEHHTRRLLESFDEGQLFVHFFGHGGRYIWRTGPPDLEKNHDLFTLEHLDQLEPTSRLPVVLSLTCYSGPFDHPNADSIGEKLLRLPDRGAIAVLAASWRNSPLPHWGQFLLRELTAPGATVGEAVRRAKNGIQDRMFVATYNLFGDPALPVALPAGEIELRAEPAAGGPLRVAGTIGLDDFDGELLLELVDSTGDVLEATLAPAGGEFALELPAAAGAAAVRAYAWDARRGVDAAGGLTLAVDGEGPR